jgi:hypothetical protein
MIRLFQFIVETLCWLNIFIVIPLILDLGTFVLYHNMPSRWTYVLFISSSVLGLVLGILWAEKVRKTIGCSVFMSSIFSSSSDNSEK